MTAFGWIQFSPIPALRTIPDRAGTEGRCGWGPSTTTLQR